VEATFHDRVERAVQSIRAQSESRPTVGIILGSGLSDVVDNLIENPEVITYENIDGFGATSVAGHRGTLSLSSRAAVMAGRFHFYECGTMDDVVLPAAVLASFGITTLVVTNAAGGISPSFRPGDLVLISDHVNLMGTNPLIGPKTKAASHRFPDMTHVYSAELRDLARSIDGDLKEGVYAALTGPSYETPAEIRMLGKLGADLVGMSTVPEVIVARSYGVRVLGISTVTNLAAGLSGEELDHSEVVAVGTTIRDRMVRLLSGLITQLGE
jgi:purine-nucleoside phosphorylase